MHSEDVDQNLKYLEHDIPPNPDMHEYDQASVDDSMSQDSNKAEEEHEETTMSELLAYSDLIFKVPAYEWLVTSLRKEFRMAPAEPNFMDAIRRKIVHSLPSSHKV